MERGPLGVVFWFLLLVVLGPCTIAMTNSDVHHPPQTKSDGIKLSLWLIPPDEVFHKLKGQIERLADNGKEGPVFEPHITIVGGIQCDSESHAMEIAEKLEEGLRHFGTIPCGIGSEAYGSKQVWNQALYFTVELSAPLMNLCQKARAILGMDTENWTFPAPATYPHLSLFYGVKNIPKRSRVESVAPFYSHQLSLWMTDPASTEGVRSWKELSTFSIR